ncbi:heavy metal-associated isoprenylated plant protein 41-like protein [Cinnamomum micranthum f. kanehirae]|uniref:Heavy metal-associated isoprenylated plant protein 41-like protein n=1 Tax=Cinnamomum micranthum f. kanehirae TaxID=337451 RepID=A0A443NEQ2_9MAGN|nr:heavy metal-associated isoprenylated plant protein 41-like protein [Cinnamomum micranthum f. kanehirae]
MMIRTSTTRRGKCTRAKQQKMIEDDTTDDEGEEEAKEEEGKWAKHYSSLHEILLVGEGDFSFSLCLANAFGSASNIVATSLDNYDVVTKKYSQAKSNIQNLLKMDATVLHGIDATKMKLHTDLSMRTFDRIIFNFPHAGFHGKEDEIHLIRLHRNLVQGFFRNASQMLCPNGEVHVSHKTSAPYDRWNLEELAWTCSLTLTECVNFEKADYPGYDNKRGDGAGCDMPFHLGECSTFKFRINTKKAKMISEAMAENQNVAGVSFFPGSERGKLLAVLQQLYEHPQHVEESAQVTKQQKMIEDDTTDDDDDDEEEQEQEQEEQEEEEGKWVKHYSSLHEILLVGEGDFSFSLCLANAFGSASNIVTTSLDSDDVVTKNYSQAKSNIQNLLKMGATVLHGVDATKMKLHTDLSMRKFDRIIFNFPHAGFHGKEDTINLIGLHRNLVQGFFGNASRMLRPNGEVHVSHKTSAPYDRWHLEELASKCSLSLTECVNFEKADYPGYNNKRGDGAGCDKPFRLGECSTFKFRINTKKAKMISEASASYLCGQSPLDITETQHTIPTGGTLAENQYGRARSFDGTDNLICYPQMSNPSREVEVEEEGRWWKHYFSLHQILLVGEGDFSFSLCLAKAFGSASNIVTTSLDNYELVFSCIL